MPTINFLNELARRKEPVWRLIETYLPSSRAPEGHYAMVRDYPERQGKYFRPGLVLLATELLGGDPTRAHLTAAAMQVSEDWLLIHDDIEDHSLMRRHKPTLNELHGDELAINAGDALHLIMWKMLGDNARTLEPEAGWQILETMNDILLTTTEGQYLELAWIREGRVAVSEAEYLDMIMRKTANYTVIGPLTLGALVAGKPLDDTALIAAWGLPFGYAFQIWDDYMNVCTAEEKQGKERGGDILEGKRTLILSHLLAHASDAEKTAVTEIYRKPRAEKTEAEKNYVLDLMERHGSMAYAKMRAEAYASEAKARFDAYAQILPNTSAKAIIRAGIEFVASREA